MGSQAVLIPNFTLFIQMGLFFISYALLHFLVFVPYLRLHDARRAKTSGLKEKALQEREKAEKLREEYDTFMKAERRKAAAWTDEEKKKVAEEERAIISQARDSVGEELKKAREATAQETERVRRDLAPQVVEYSSQIASKLLGRKVSVSASSAASAKRTNTESTVTG